jgi:hypothetical protein
MAALPSATTGSPRPAPFDVTTSPDPDFPPRPAVTDEHGPAALPDFPGRQNLLTRQDLGLAAAPVPVDYAPPQAPDFTVPSRAAGFVLSAGTNPASPPSQETPAPGSAPGSWSAAGSWSASAPGPGSATGPHVTAGPAADPSYIWDLAATDVFPAAVDPGPQPETPGAVSPDDDPGATSGPKPAG